MIGIPGVVLPYAGSSAPAGWLLCDGSAVSRTTYADLFSVIGTTFGAGDGSTTFNLPDPRGRGVIGAGQGSGLTNRALGATGGAETHTLAESEIPSHTHTATLKDAGSAANGAFGRLSGGGGTHNNGATTNATGGGGAHNNMQPFLALNLIIKY